MNSPLVVSASRRTDVPAFYADWFMSRMVDGFCDYVNPFNHKPVRVDLSQVKCVVFWTKNPRPMMKHLKKLDDMGIKYYFQYTLNNYFYCGIEPELDSVYERMDTFRELSQMIGKEKVILRYDPMILVGNHSVDELLNNVIDVLDGISQCTEKIVFSFADLEYRKVKMNFAQRGLWVRDFTDGEMHHVAKFLSDYGMYNSIKIATCSEAIDFSQYGIEHNKCIDPELILRITDKDPKVEEYLKGASGQRRLCGCAKSVDIGMYDTCMHNCTYCYATKNKELACINYERHIQNPNKSSIV